MSEAPPLAWLVADPERRKRAWRYWVRDTCMGLLNVAVHYALRALPIDLCSQFGAVMSATAARRYPRADARARALWERVRGDIADSAAADAAMASLWRCVGRTMAEYSVIDRLLPAGRIAVEGAEHLSAARASGRPTIVAGLHLGNWETIFSVISDLGHRARGIYLQPDNRFEHRVAVRARGRCGVVLEPSRPISARIAHRALLENRGPFVIFIDDSYRGRVHAPAFGRPLRATGNIANVVRLSAMTGAAVVPVYCLREGDAARFTVTFLPALDFPADDAGDGGLMANIGRLNAIIEPIVAAHLEQWFYALEFSPET